MLRHLVRGLCRSTGGLTLVASAIGVLAGVEYFMSSRSAQQQPVERKRTNPVPAARVDYFTIRRTRFELGYTYWILQGFGKHKCFVLCDTWQEAMNEATLRLKTAPAPEEQLEAVAVGASF